MIAAVGTDGLRAVVWGVGDCAASALADASVWLINADGNVDTLAMAVLTFYAVSAEDAAVIVAGDCSWPVARRVP